MTSAADIQRLLDIHMRRLQILREQQARMGINADPDIVIEIEEIEATIDTLRATLAGAAGPPDASAGLAGIAGPPDAAAAQPPSAGVAGLPGQQNQGVIVTGGTLSANQMAVGPGSRAIQVTHSGAGDSRAAAEERVARGAVELLRALERHAAAVEDSGDLARAIRQVVEEARKTQPSRLALKSLLSGIAGALSEEASLAPKLLELQSAVEQLIGLLKA